MLKLLVKLVAVICILVAVLLGMEAAVEFAWLTMHTEWLRASTMLGVFSICVVLGGASTYLLHILEE